MRSLFLLLFIVTASVAGAQQDDEYRMEIGAGVGLTGYQGDFNSSITKKLQPMASVVLRRILNPYMALRASLACGKLKGGSADEETFYPGLDAEPVEFNNTLIDFGVTYEYNFWPYGTGRDYRGAQRITPFILVGIGGTYVDTGEKSVVTANIPIGVGVKFKIARRVNLGVEWAMHFSLSDELDGVRDPYGISSTGLFKNTDCYSALQFTLTYSFMPKCRTCNNDKY